MTTIQEQIKKQIKESEKETALYLQEEASLNISYLESYKPKHNKIKMEMSEFIGGLK